MKDWSKERWRKLYIREALEQRRWSVATRGLRDYLIRFADDDGALIRDSDDPVEDLLLVLGAHATEAEHVRAAIRVLREDGFLGGCDRSLFVVNLPAAQAREQSEPGPPTGARPKPLSSGSSNERVRKFRERQRQNRRADAAATTLVADASTLIASAASNVTAAAGATVPRATGNVTAPVTSAVTSSRGSRNPKRSEDFLDFQKDKQADLLPSSTRASDVTSPVTSTVTAVTSSASAEPVRDDEEEELRLSSNQRELLNVPLQIRAIEVREHPASAAASRPERWPEVIPVARAYARAAGLPELRLGRYDRDSGVRAIVDLYAAGFTQDELEHVATIVPKQSWWFAAGKRLGLSSMSIEVVRRNLPGIGPPREASPTVAKVLANVQRRREAG